MSLSKIQFDILCALEKAKCELSQRKLSLATNKSIGTINKAISELTSLGYIDNKVITDAGLKALEPYRVKRAIFIAAGFGTRLVPITLNTPKPLVRVNGKRIIETLLDAVTRAEIEEIYIIRGYLAKQFDELLYKYPNIKFIDNPDYNEANNISSAVCAKDLISNSYVLEGDLLVYNPDIITKYQYNSNYMGIKVEKSDDWCLHMNGNKISGVSIGGVNCHQMLGVSYWTEEDGKKLSEHLVSIYNSPGGKEAYWDEVPLKYFIKEYNLSIRECTFDDIVEIDTFKELKMIDSSYETKY